jgi:type I restriction enzyme R subunit
MSPETKARLIIDAKLAAAGWRVQDLKQINLGAAVAVREYPTDTGPADQEKLVVYNLAATD